MSHRFYVFNFQTSNLTQQSIGSWWRKLPVAWAMPPDFQVQGEFQFRLCYLLITGLWQITEPTFSHLWTGDANACLPRFSLLNQYFFEHLHVLGTRDMAANKTDKIPASMKLTFQWEKNKNGQVSVRNVMSVGDKQSEELMREPREGQEGWWRRFL